MPESRPKRVLVIEDSKPTRQLLEVCFDKSRYSLFHQTDGPGGLEAALSGDYDIVLLDIGLPGMDGWEVLRRLREQKSSEELPVVVLTAHHDTVLTEQGPLSQSVDGFLAKPFDVIELEDTVERIIGEAASPTGCTV